MSTVSNALLRSSAVAIVLLGGVFWLKPMMISFCDWSWGCWCRLSLSKSVLLAWKFCNLHDLFLYYFLCKSCNRRDDADRPITAGFGGRFLERNDHRSLPDSGDPSSAQGQTNQTSQVASDLGSEMFQVEGTHAVESNGFRVDHGFDSTLHLLLRYHMLFLLQFWSFPLEGISPNRLQESRHVWSSQAHTHMHELSLLYLDVKKIELKFVS